MTHPSSECAREWALLYVGAQCLLLALGMGLAFPPPVPSAAPPGLPPLHHDRAASEARWSTPPRPRHAPAPAMVWDVDIAHATRVAERVHNVTRLPLAGVLTPFTFNKPDANTQAHALGAELRALTRVYVGLGVALPFVFFSMDGADRQRRVHPFCYFVAALMHEADDRDLRHRGVFVSSGNHASQAALGAVCDQFGVSTRGLRRVTWARPPEPGTGAAVMLILERGVLLPGAAEAAVNTVLAPDVDAPLDVVVSVTPLSSSEATVAAATMHAAGYEPQRAGVNCTHVYSLTTGAPQPLPVPYCNRTLLWNVDGLSATPRAQLLL